MKSRQGFDGSGKSEQHRLPKSRRHHLESDRKAGLVEAYRHRDRRVARQFDGMVHTSQRYMASGS